MDFYTQFESLLESASLEKCYELFYLKENEKYLNEYSWDLASLFVNHLSKSVDLQKPVLEFVEAANLHLCQFNGNPRELFLIYLENTDFFFNRDINFLKLIDLIQILLLRVSSKFIYHSIELAVDQFLKYFRSKVRVTNKEKNDDLGTQLRLNLLYGKFLDFVQTFVHKELDNVLNDFEKFSLKLKHFFTIVLVNLFNEPFLGIRFENEEWNYSSLMGKTLQLINTMNRDLFKLVGQLEDDLKIKTCAYKSSDEEEKETDTKTVDLSGLSISSFVYYLCLFKWSDAPGLASQAKSSFGNFPNVYNHLFILENFLPILTRLLAFDQQQPSDSLNSLKGLHAIQILVNRIEDASLHCYLLECDSIMELFDFAFKISVYAQTEQVRKSSNELLKKFFKKLNRRARFEFLKDFLNQNVHSDETFHIYVCSFLIYLFKEELNESLAGDDFYSSQSSSFKYLFRLVCKLHNGEQTDLVQQSSKIIACLNLLRYLLIRDRRENLTGVFDLIGQVAFLNELEKAVQLSKAHYELENRTLLSQSHAQIKEVNNNHTVHVNFGLQNGNVKKLREPSKRVRLEALQNALQTIDLIECLRVRVYEIWNEKKN